MGLKKTHEHESGFFEELTNVHETSKNHLNSIDGKMKRHLNNDYSRGQNSVSVIDDCNNVECISESGATNCDAKRCKEFAQTRDKQKAMATIVIDSDEDGENEIEPHRANGKSSRKQQQTPMEDDDGDCEILESTTANQTERNESGDCTIVEVTCNGNNNNKTNEKTKNGGTDTKSAEQLMREIEAASTIRPQGKLC